MTLAEFQAERDAQLERERRAMREEKCWLLMSLLAFGIPILSWKEKTMKKKTMIYGPPSR